mgnify:CR=1 FL=1
MSGVRGRAIAFSLTDDDLRPSILVTVDITLLYFNDCPNWLIANDHLETLVVEHPEIVITRHIVDTAEEAAHTGFRGSPSILVDGHDPFAGPGDLVFIPKDVMHSVHAIADGETTWMFGYD